MFVFGDCWRCIRKASANKNLNQFFKVRPCDFLKLKTLPSARPKLLHPCTESLVIFCNKNRKKTSTGLYRHSKGFLCIPRQLTCFLFSPPLLLLLSLPCRLQPLPRLPSFAISRAFLRDLKKNLGESDTDCYTWPRGRV